MYLSNLNNLLQKRNKLYGTTSSEKSVNMKSVICCLQLVNFRSFLQQEALIVQ